MSRGEVWWAERPEPGRRPFLVLSRDAATPVLGRPVCVPATRTIRGLPTEVVLDEADGMPARCALSADNVTVVPRSLLVERICLLRGERLVEVCRALSFASGCAAA